MLGFHRQDQRPAQNPRLFQIFSESPESAACPPPRGILADSGLATLGSATRRGRSLFLFAIKCCKHIRVKRSPVANPVPGGLHGAVTLVRHMVTGHV